MGQDKQVAVVGVRLSVLPAEEVEGPVEADPEAKGPRRVEVTILNALHLPKMDTFGSIDPYCDVEFLGTVYKTSVKKNTYTPTWDEVLTFDVEDVTADPGPLRITVMDWDRVGESEKVGMVVIPAVKMQEVVRGRIGWKEERVRQVRDGSKPVVGQDKQVAVVGVRLRLFGTEDESIKVDFENEALGSRRLEVSIMEVLHAPCIVSSESIHFYFNCSFADSSFDSKLFSNVLPSKCGDSFVFFVEDITERQNPLCLNVICSERFGAMRSLGSLMIPGKTMSDVLKCHIGWEDVLERSVSLRGQLVIGEDNEIFTIRLRVRPKPADEFSIPAFVSESKGSMAIQVTVLNARNLPQNDHSGAIHAVCDVEFGGHSFQTEVRRGTSDPDWGDSFIYHLADIAADPGPLRITLLDWKGQGMSEVIGRATVTAAAMTAILRGAPGWEAESSLQLILGGKLVTCEDDQKVATVGLRLHLLPEEEGADQSLSVDAAASGPRRLEVTVLGAENLPPITSEQRFSADSKSVLCTLEFEGATYDTAPSANGSRWGDIFLFDVADVSVPPGPLRIAVECFYRYEQPQKVGNTVMPSDYLWRIMRCPIGSEEYRSLRLMDGYRVVCASGREARLALRLRVLASEDCCLIVDKDPISAGQRQLEVSVVRARGLPHSGRDSFCHVDFNQAEGVTRVADGEDSPAWGDTFVFHIRDVGSHTPGQLSIRVLGWEGHSGSTKIGSAAVSANCMWDIVRAHIGWRNEIALRLTNGGRVVMGPDGTAAEVVVQIVLLAAVYEFKSFARLELCFRLERVRTCREKSSHPDQADREHFVAGVLEDIAAATAVDPCALRVSGVRGRLTAAGTGPARHLVGRPTVLVDVSSEAHSSLGLGAWDIARSVVQQANDHDSNVALRKGKYTSQLVSAALEDKGLRLPSESAAR